MGQMTFALLFGCKMGKAPKSLGEEGWWELAEQYGKEHKAKPAVDYIDELNAHVLGFWIAAGASGKRGTPALGSFPLDDLMSIPVYKESHGRAVEAWAAFAVWAREEKGIDVGVPRAWLVQTEVA